MAKVKTVNVDENSKPVKTALPKTIAELQLSFDKKFGAGTVILGNVAIKVDSFKSGIMQFDEILGCGGIPRGRIIEIFGYESSGKTTLCLEIIRACQQTFNEAKQRDGVAAFIDAEHALDPMWARNIGVDMDKVLISQPDCGEDAIEIARAMALSGLVDLIIIDSVAALVPRKQLEGDISDANVGIHARLMSNAMKALQGAASKSGTTIIFINQVRQKIGVMFGSPDTTTGGLSLKFYASMRIEVRKAAQLKADEVMIGNRVKVKMVKNKCAPPFKETEFDICFGASERPIYGVDKIASLLDCAVARKVVTKNGNFFVYGEQRLGNGQGNSLACLRESPELVTEIREKIYTEMLQSIVTVPAIDQEPEDLLDMDED